MAGGQTLVASSSRWEGARIEDDEEVAVVARMGEAMLPRMGGIATPPRMATMTRMEGGGASEDGRQRR